jgi:redox-sensitive bicupin YhaK (pirin superfamily)
MSTRTVQQVIESVVCPYEGNMNVGPASAERVLTTHNAGVLSGDDRVEASATATGARFLLLAGRPLREPVVQYGPFVMNIPEGIEQAIRDYQNGELTRPAA